MDESEKDNLFASIREGNVSAVIAFFDRNPDVTPLTAEGKSAARVALESEEVEVYEVLIKRGWCLNPGEDFHDIVKKFKGESKEKEETGKEKKENEQRRKRESKEKLRKVHKVFLRNPNEKHLTSLITRTSIYFAGRPAGSNRRNYLDAIAGAYEELNDIREVKAILKVVANIEKLIIIFDFDRNSIEHADATASQSVNGKCYSDTTGEIYIGVKLLLENRYKALGVIAHELCHCAIFFKYNNDFKPFYKNDENREEEFWNVYKACNSKIKEEPLIAAAINSPAKFKLDELIVRVPHLLVHYKEDTNKIALLKDCFGGLFSFFDRLTLPELEDEHELMAAVWKLKLKEPQHLTEMKICLQAQSVNLEATQVLELKSNSPQVTMNAIYQKLCSERKFKTSFIFLALHHMKDKDNLELTEKASRSCLKPTIVINCDNEIKDEVIKTFNAMKEAGINGSMIFIHNLKEFLYQDSIHQEYSHKWSELTDEAKQQLVNRMVFFQGQEILLKEVADLGSSALDHVPLKRLLDNNLEVGGGLQFPEIDVYIARKFLDSEHNEVELSSLLEIAAESKLILLSDDAGMGKTTELKTIAMKIKNKLSTFWVSFIDLKEFSEHYRKDESFEANFNTPEDIASFFVTKILKLNDFEAGIFRQLFLQDRVVFLMDGFDEISPTFNSFVTALIRVIKFKSMNILVTSTRPHLKKILSTKLNVQAYTFKPLTQENCDEILELHFKKFEFSEGVFNEKLSRTKEFFKRLNSSSDAVSNPLLLRLVATVFSEEKYALVTQPNTFSIYENFIKMMILNSTKKGDVVNMEALPYYLSEDNIMPFHQKEAFHELFRNSGDEIKKSFTLLFKDLQSPSIEMLQRIGLIKVYGPGKFVFIHRTFAEFFVADFLFKNTFGMKGLENRQRKEDKTRIDIIEKLVRDVFNNGPTSDFFFAVRSFIDGAFEISIESLDKKALLSTFCSIFTWADLQLVFISFVDDSFINLVEVISQIFKNNDRKLLKLWTNKQIPSDNNMLMIAAEKGSLYFNVKLLHLAENFLGRENMKKLLIEKNKLGDIAVMTAMKNNMILGVYDLYMEQIDKLFGSGSDRIYEENIDLMERRMAHMWLKSLLKCKNFNQFEQRLDEIEQKLGVNRKLLLSSALVDGRTIYFEACTCLVTIEEFRCLWKLLSNVLGQSGFKKILLKPDRDGTTPLMTKSFLSKDVFMAFWELISSEASTNEKEKLLLEENKLVGYNLFDWAMMSRELETFSYVKDLYVEIIGISKMKEILMRRRTNGDFSLHISVLSNYDNSATIEALWSFIQELYDEETQKEILLQRNAHDETFYPNGLKSRFFDKKIKVFLSFMEGNLTENEKVHLKIRKIRWAVWAKVILESTISDVVDDFYFLVDYFVAAINSIRNFFC